MWRPQQCVLLCPVEDQTFYILALLSVDGHHGSRPSTGALHISSCSSLRSTQIISAKLAINPGHMEMFPLRKCTSHKMIDEKTCNY
jgi:hypothetical protein